MVLMELQHGARKSSASTAQKSRLRLLTTLKLKNSGCFGGGDCFETFDF
jgi:hypothetical protein